VRLDSGLGSRSSRRSAPLAIEAEATALILMAGPVALALVIAGFLWVPASACSFFGLDQAVENIA
jgi:hypothetical protein